MPHLQEGDQDQDSHNLLRLLMEEDLEVPLGSKGHLDPLERLKGDTNRQRENVYGL